MNQMKLSMTAAAVTALTTVFAMEAAEARTAPYTVQDCKGYNSWPMMQAIGSRLVCTYSRGTGHNIGEGVRGVFARTSDDHGKTWSPEVCVADEPNYGEVTIGKGLDADGAMLLWVRCFGGPKNHHDLYRTQDGVAFEKISTPDFAPLPVQITDIFHIPGKGMMALWFAGNYKDDNSHSWGTLVSTDNGHTWTQTTIEMGLSRADWPTEQSAVYVGNGKILALARTEIHGSSGGVQFQLTSTDSGVTWKRERTNIGDILCSTPSLVYDEQTGLISNYYFERGKGLVKRRVNALSDVWSNPTGWAEPEVVGVGSERPWDTGNVNATVIGRTHFLAYYSGNAPDTAVYVLPVLAPDRGK
ncbi:MAG TPA: sialidase family protein [Kiritimatiellia bacterium]|nr:sialidase family protein [Kiritimatiellia bacterium]HRU70291.1 sialidase family protein [Kiritimatiellia bacterium]